MQSASRNIWGLNAVQQVMESWLCLLLLLLDCLCVYLRIQQEAGAEALSNAVSTSLSLQWESRGRDM